jgi:GMP synthase (glutamine-hydrolysing) A subunit
MTHPTHQRLLIVDFGSQVTQLIARRLREARIYCEIHPYQTVDAAFLADFRPQAVILSGGPASVTEAGSPRAAAEIFTLGVPVLGVCYGQQVMMVQLGGAVEGGHHAEFGRAYVTPTETRDPLFTGLFQTGREEVWMSHGDRVTALAPGFLAVFFAPFRGALLAPPFAPARALRFGVLPPLASRSARRVTACSIVTSSGSVSFGIVALVFSCLTYGP